MIMVAKCVCNKCGAEYEVDLDEHEDIPVRHFCGGILENADIREQENLFS